MPVIFLINIDLASTSFGIFFNFDNKTCEIDFSVWGFTAGF